MIGFSFKSFFTINESIDLSFDQWFHDVKNYAKTTESDLKKLVLDGEDAQPGSLLLPEDKKKIIIKVLKEKNKENQNFLKFALGFFMTKPHMQIEDLQQAIDALEWKVSSGSLSRKIIESTGWFNTGKQGEQFIDEKRNSQVSSADILRQKKAGVGGEDLKIFAQKNNITIYHSPAAKNEKQISDRHIQLCRYGKGTRWCTAEPTWDAHRNYKDADIYIIYKNNNPIFQFTYPNTNTSGQFMNTNDQPQKFVDEDVHDLLQEVLPNVIKEFNLKKLISVEEFEKLSSENKSEYIKSIAELGGTNVALNFVKEPTSWGDSLIVDILSKVSPHNDIWLQDMIKFAVEKSRTDIFDMAVNPYKYGLQEKLSSNIVDYTKHANYQKLQKFASLMADDHASRETGDELGNIFYGALQTAIRMKKYDFIQKIANVPNIKIYLHGLDDLKDKNIISVLFKSKEEFDALSNMEKISYLNNLGPRMWRQYLPEEIDENEPLFIYSPKPAIEYAVRKQDQQLMDKIFTIMQKDQSHGAAAEGLAQRFKTVFIDAFDYIGLSTYTRKEKVFFATYALKLIKKEKNPWSSDIASKAINLLLHDSASILLNDAPQTIKEYEKQTIEILNNLFNLDKTYDKLKDEEKEALINLLGIQIIHHYENLDMDDFEYETIEGGTLNIPTRRLQKIKHLFNKGILSRNLRMCEIASDHLAKWAMWYRERLGDREWEKKYHRELDYFISIAMDTKDEKFIRKFLNVVVKKQIDKGILSPRLDAYYSDMLNKQHGK